MGLLPVPDGSSATVVTATTAIATVALLAFCRWSLYPAHGKVIPNPLKTVLPSLSKDEVARLPYAPDAFPGARDIETPYGSMRTYEFGPENGRKVLLVHGISTSCQTLARIAHSLVREGGCRVLLFDLFGRGFSDGVGDVPHDARLYVSQMLLALAASPLAWTGDGALDVVGYSMGGGVAIHFAAAFPRLVRSLVLLAPAGVIRLESFGLAARLVFRSGLVPARLLAAITRRRLQQPIASSAKKRRRRASTRSRRRASSSLAAVVPASVAASMVVIPPADDPIELLAAEVDDPNGGGATSGIDSGSVTASSEDGGSEVDEAGEEGVVVVKAAPLHERVMAYVRWMLTHHAGFVPAFMSCIRYAPLTGQQDVFAAMASRPAGSVCVVLGADDEIIHPAEYEVDALPLLGGRDKVRWRIVPGGHDFPMTHAPETMREIYAFWS